MTETKQLDHLYALIRIAEALEKIAAILEKVEGETDYGRSFIRVREVERGRGT